MTLDREIFDSAELYAESARIMLARRQTECGKLGYQVIRFSEAGEKCGAHRPDHSLIGTFPTLFAGWEACADDAAKARFRERQQQYVKVDERLWPSGLQRVDGKPCTILSDAFASYEAQRLASEADKDSA